MASRDTPKPLWIKSPLAALADGAENGIVVSDGVIIELVGLGQTPGRFDGAATHDEFDATDMVMLPGLVNTHHHFYQTLTRAHRQAINKPLFPWLQALYPIWRYMTPDLIAVSTRLALAELLMSGCTTAADHHYLFTDEIEHAIDIQVEEVRAAGMRAVLTRGSMSLSIEDGGLPPREVVQREDVILSESERLIRRYHETGDGARVQIALAPCSPFSCTPQCMRDTATLARQHGVRLHTHIAETNDETEHCLSAYGMRPVELLADVGWIGDDVWLAHGIHFNAEEVKLLGDAGVGVCHCPSSNMVLASGICPVLDLESHGAAVGLGVDGSASNDCSNMIQEVRQALMLQRIRYGAENIDHHRALSWVTKGSARCLGRDDIGEIAVGKRADLAFYRLDELRFSGAQDPIAALVLCGAHRADAVMVDGVWQVLDGSLCNIDEAALRVEHQAAAEALWRAAS
jgi:8-oxoguanine deaminase